MAATLSNRKMADVTLPGNGRFKIEGKKLMLEDIAKLYLFWVTILLD